MKKHLSILILMSSLSLHSGVTIKYKNNYKEKASAIITYDNPCGSDFIYIESGHDNDYQGKTWDWGNHNCWLDAIYIQLPDLPDKNISFSRASVRSAFSSNDRLSDGTMTVIINSKDDTYLQGDNGKKVMGVIVDNKGTIK